MVIVCTVLLLALEHLFRGNVDRARTHLDYNCEQHQQHKVAVRDDSSTYLHLGGGNGGQRSPKGAGHRKKTVSHMFKYSVFDINPTYNV